jgi:hypothetical protein
MIAVILSDFAYGTSGDSLAVIHHLVPRAEVVLLAGENGPAWELLSREWPDFNLVIPAQFPLDAPDEGARVLKKLAPEVVFSVMNLGAARAAVEAGIPCVYLDNLAWMWRDPFGLEHRGIQGDLRAIRETLQRIDRYIAVGLPTAGGELLGVEAKLHQWRDQLPPTEVIGPIVDDSNSWIIPFDARPCARSGDLPLTLFNHRTSYVWRNGYTPPRWPPEHWEGIHSGEVGVLNLGGLRSPISGPEVQQDYANVMWDIACRALVDFSGTLIVAGGSGAIDRLREQASKLSLNFNVIFGSFSQRKFSQILAYSQFCLTSPGMGSVFRCLHLMVPFVCPLGINESQWRLLKILENAKLFGTEWPSTHGNYKLTDFDRKSQPEVAEDIGRYIAGLRLDKNRVQRLAEDVDYVLRGDGIDSLMDEQNQLGEGRLPNGAPKAARIILDVREHGMIPGRRYRMRPPATDDELTFLF